MELYSFLLTLQRTNRLLIIDVKTTFKFNMTIIFYHGIRIDPSVNQSTSLPSARAFRAVRTRARSTLALCRVDRRAIGVRQRVNLNTYYEIS